MAKSDDKPVAAEEGRASVSPGPQRKQDDPAYADPGRSVHYDQSVACKPASTKALGPGLGSSANETELRAGSVEVKDGVARQVRK